jgi:hypothetical protein
MEEHLLAAAVLKPAFSDVNGDSPVFRSLMDIDDK